jgi:hypothetical protein
LRDQLLAEIAGLNHNDELALWAQRRLPAKNMLVADDARIVEVAYQVALDAADREPKRRTDEVPHPTSDVSSIGARDGSVGHRSFGGRRSIPVDRRTSLAIETSSAAKQSPSYLCRGATLPCLSTLAV